jgi:hypothetical protein
MRAIRLSSFGGPDALELTEIPEPSPADGEEVVDVRAVALGRWDLLAPEGWFAALGRSGEFPQVQGREFAGEAGARRVLARGMREPPVCLLAADPLRSARAPGCRSPGGAATGVRADVAAAPGRNARARPPPRWSSGRERKNCCPVSSAKARADTKAGLERPAAAHLVFAKSRPPPPPVVT